MHVAAAIAQAGQRRLGPGGRRRALLPRGDSRAARSATGSQCALAEQRGGGARGRRGPAHRRGGARHPAARPERPRGVAPAARAAARRCAWSMLSAHTDQEYVLEALRLGACDYLAKPLHEEELKLCGAARARGLRDGFELERAARAGSAALAGEVEALLGDGVRGERGSRCAARAAEAVGAAARRAQDLDPAARRARGTLRVAAATGRKLTPEELDAVADRRGRRGPRRRAGRADRGRRRRDATRASRPRPERPLRHRARSSVMPLGVGAGALRRALRDGSPRRRSRSARRTSRCCGCSSLTLAPLARPAQPLLDADRSRGRRRGIRRRGAAAGRSGRRRRRRARPRDLRRDDRARSSRRACSARRCARSPSALRRRAGVGLPARRRERRRCGARRSGTAAAPRIASRCRATPGSPARRFESGPADRVRRARRRIRASTPSVDTPEDGAPAPLLVLPLRFRGTHARRLPRLHRRTRAPRRRAPREVLGAALSAAVRNVLLYRSLRRVDRRGGARARRAPRTRQ